MTRERRLTREERREVMVFLGFTALCLTAIATAVILHDSWSATQWDGLTAIATVVQAAGVLAALFYAGVQVSTHRHEARRQRADDLVDRLTTQLYDELIPAATEFQHQYAFALNVLRAWFDQPYEAVRFAELYGQTIEGCRGAATRAETAGRRMKLAWKLLGNHDSDLDNHLSHLRYLLSIWLVLPIALDDISVKWKSASDVPTDTATRNDQDRRLAVIEQQVEDYVRRHVADDL